MTAAFASSAFRLALRGRAVFPLAVGSKVPLPGSHGFLEANREADVARARWNKWPSANTDCRLAHADGTWPPRDVPHAPRKSTVASSPSRRRASY